MRWEGVVLDYGCYFLRFESRYIRPLPQFWFNYLHATESFALESGDEEVAKIFVAKCSDMSCGRKGALTPLTPSNTPMNLSDEIHL